VGGSTTTDDSGEYRIAGLAAGRYVAAIQTTNANAVAQNDRGRLAYRVTRQKIYYPNTADRDSAEPIVLAPGEERENVDFAVSADQNGGPLGMIATLLRPEMTTGRAAFAGASRARMVGSRARARATRHVDRSYSASFGDDRRKRPLRVYRRCRRHVPGRRDETGLRRDDRQRHARGVLSSARRRTDDQRG
jgi:hypothetical protein